MNVDIERTTDREEWNQCVERSSGTSAFHCYEALRIQARHSNSRVHPLVGYVGEEPVGLFPVFELQKGPITGAFSPPPALWVPALGPALLNVAKLKRRKRERRHEAFVTGCLDWIDREVGPQYIRIEPEWRYHDVRPFLWNGCTMTPKFTYTLDLTIDEDERWMRFDSEVRRRIRNADTAEYTIEQAGADGAAAVVEHVRERIRSQEKAFSLPTEFVTDLAECLPDAVRTYVCRIDGTYVGGSVNIEHGDTVVGWQGNAKPPADVTVPVNELLDWHIIRDATDRGFSTLEIVGAGDPRLNRFKSKLDPTLRTKSVLERGSPVVTALVEAYTRFG